VKRGLWSIVILSLLSMSTLRDLRLRDDRLMGRGGKRIAEKWGTDVMENQEENLTAAMVRWLYPLSLRLNANIDETGECRITRCPTSKGFRRYIQTNVLHGEKDV